MYIWYDVSMMKLVIQVLKYIFENGPNAVFWLGVLVVGFGWYSHQNLIFRIVLK